LPRTSAALAAWDGAGDPPSDALIGDLLEADEAGRWPALSLRLNREGGGLQSLFRATLEGLMRGDRKLGMIDARWLDAASWDRLAAMVRPFTAVHLLNALDLRLGDGGGIAWQEDGRRLYLALFLRTVLVALGVTACCLLLGYPLAYLMASAGPRLRGLLLFVVMLPFWTSLLVRTTAWIVLLQRKGVINDLLVSLGAIREQERLALVYNMTGTMVAMVHVLLPFFVLPLYSVMRGIPATYVRAGASLGARPFHVFRRVYWPLTLPGVSAGGALVFILALGYYVTPALVGGRTGQLISNQIAFHMQRSLNWGLAAALGGLLLLLVIVIFAALSRVARLREVAS
jgi:putative spermidine/putrescine transport system permease protein